MPQSQIALDKQIQRNQILSLLVLLIFIAGVATSIYFFNQLKETNLELEKTIQELKESKGIIGEQGKVIALKDSLITINTQKIAAIRLLGVLLNDEENKEYTEDEILQNLTKLAEDKKAEIAQHNADRTATIEKLFTSNESGRKAARNKLIQDFGDDKKLVKEMTDYALNGKVNKKYENSLYQVVYIFTQLSNPSLIKHKNLILKFMTEMKAANLVGTYTQQDFNMIKKKMKT